MKAMVLGKLARVDENREPLTLACLPEPAPGEREVLVRVSACGVCHTELDEIEGRTPPSQLPIVPGHQIVGRVARLGANARRFSLGDRVGVAWIFSACGTCPHCLAGEENLCDRFVATGRDVNGGYAELAVVHEDFAYPIPDRVSDVQAAPLLCAGAIGYRSLRLARLADGRPLGLVGFGASAHLVLKMARHRFPRSAIYVFARSEAERSFARALGAAWAGTIEEVPPEKLAAAIDTTPAWQPIVHALRNLRPGGRLVVNAIRKEDADKAALCAIDWATHLWLEKELKSVANVTRADVLEFLELAAAIPILPEVQTYRLEEANRALVELKERKIRGAKVLVIEDEAAGPGGAQRPAVDR